MHTYFHATKAHIQTDNTKTATRWSRAIRLHRQNSATVAYCTIVPLSQHAAKNRRTI